jgi:hypothetical protein
MPQLFLMFRFGTICLAEGSRKDPQFAEEILNYTQGFCGNFYLMKITWIGEGGMSIRANKESKKTREINVETSS